MKSLIVVLSVFMSVLTITQNRMNPELLWDLKRVGAANVSPDGTKMFYSVRSYNLVDNNAQSYV